jgi:hypothetical protein
MPLATETVNLPFQAKSSGRLLRSAGAMHPLLVGLSMKAMVDLGK